jgi:hypothetical protein
MEDTELRAMQDVLKAIDGCDEATKMRVISWVAERLGIHALGGRSPRNSAGSSDRSSESTRENKGLGLSTFAELFNAASPSTNPQKALVAAYWLQVSSGQDTFSSQSVNKELQDLGHAIQNVTQAFTQLQDRKPALAIQVKKSGKSQQARKLYKLTYAGVETVNGMLAGHTFEEPKD